MQDLWLAFAKDPVNSLPTMGWPAFTPTGNATEFAWNNVVMQNISVSRFSSQCMGAVGVANVQVPDLDLVDPAAYSAALAASNGGQATFFTSGVSRMSAEIGLTLLTGVFTLMML